MSALSQQLKGHQQKKKYDSLMTEHERRVNDKDIKAYEDVDTSQLNSMMIPGLGNHYNTNQQAYI